MGLQKSRTQPKQLGMHAWSSLLYGLSLVAASGGCSPAVVLGLLTAVASLIVERGLESTGPVVVMHGLSCPMPVESSQTRDPNSHPLHWQADS